MKIRGARAAVDSKEHDFRWVTQAPVALTLEGLSLGFGKCIEVGLICDKLQLCGSV